jgi:hypothetical protein
MQSRVNTTASSVVLVQAAGGNAPGRGVANDGPRHDEVRYGWSCGSM